MITPAQSRAARGLIEWSQEQLADASHLGLSTIRDFEKSRRVPTHNNLLGIRGALEAAGVIFVDENGDGPGVRLKKSSTAPIQEPKPAAAGSGQPSGEGEQPDDPPVSPITFHKPRRRTRRLLGE